MTHIIYTEPYTIGANEKMLIEDRIKDWREDEEAGYCHVIELVCVAETELRRLRALVADADLPQA